jgi:hypothetical protein
VSDNPETARSNRKVLLDDICKMDSPSCVMDEVRNTIRMYIPDIDLTRVEKAHSDIVSLFEGKYPGFRACNIGYHDICHTMDVFIVIARLLHGMHIEGVRLVDFQGSVEGVKIGRRDTILALISALMHDTGYIQRADDTEGTGGKYTQTHVARSIEFMREYFLLNGFSPEDADKAAQMIESTSLTADFRMMDYATAETKALAMMLFSSDLIGQMADKAYLEKLSALYDEFVEGKVEMFSDEKDLMMQTTGFVRTMRGKIEKELRNADKYLVNHFKARCRVERDLYHESIERNLKYLDEMLKCPDADRLAEIKRMGSHRGPWQG